MNRRSTSGLRVLMVGLVALGLLGCFATVPVEHPTVKAIRPDDIKTLAGQWDGAFRPPTGRTFPVSLQINADRTYEVRTDESSNRGTLQAKDDKLVLIPRDTSGPTAPIQSTATLLVAQDGLRVLSGTGASESGPFSFEVRSYEAPKKK